MQRVIASLCQLMIVLVSVSVTELASAETIVEKLKVGGSFLTSRIDANSDGVAASWCTTQVKGGLQGSSMVQCVNEDVFAGFTADCPGGLFVVDSIQGTGTGVRTFPSGNDQIFIALTERRLCANLAGQFTEGLDRGLIIGGTGKFQGASGTYEWVYTGQILYFDNAANPAQFFGSFNGTGQWVIQTLDE